MKKVLSLTLSCVLAITAISGTVLAAETTNEAAYLVEQGYLKGTENGLELDRDATGAEALTMLYRVSDMEDALAEAKTTVIYGTLSFDENGTMLTTEDGIEYILHTDGAVAVIGEEIKGFEEAKAELEGKELSVVIGSTMTLSLPAQANALYFLAATEDKNPIYIEVGAVSEENGVISIESADHRYTFNMEKMMDLTPIATRNIVKALDLNAGDRVVVYSDIMTMSIPAQLVPNKVLVLEQFVKPEHWAGDIIEDAEDKEIIETSSPETLTVYGTLEITEEGALLKAADGNVYLLNTENTAVYQGSEISEIAALNGKEVAAVVSPNMTRSIPAKTNAYYILSATETENPIYLEISEVSEEDGVIRAESADGQYAVVLDKMFDLTPAKTKNIIKAVDLKKGDRILAYSNMMTMSIPAILNPEKVIVLEQSKAFNPDDSISAESFVELAIKIFNEKAKELASLITEDVISRDTLVKFCYALLK